MILAICCNIYWAVNFLWLKSTVGCHVPKPICSQPEHFHYPITNDANFVSPNFKVVDSGRYSFMYIARNKQAHAPLRRHSRRSKA
ncbi:hypothetical protein K2173_020758 [Erythroxylum novogranatense]|uniref:Secreted protein n=1 Tax=Erythroxylum novogranatense TaxID=1862640 RepID=A0AAV8TM16_9ROSI|nr:hypothetical protein K2173_020758 [Erythroxylum novogranatense]